MPWTFAHPAAVIPLARYCPALLNFPALVIGSITPDLGYHLLRKDFAAFAHSLQGSLLLCLPSGLLLFGLLCLLREPLLYLLPQPHRAALAPMVAPRALIDLRVLLSVSASIVLGSWTHIVWDGFTHNDGWAVLRLEVLQQSVFQVAGVDVHLYNILQHFSTCLGVAILAAAYWRWLSRRPASRPAPYFRREDAWRYLALGALAVATVAFALTRATLAAEAFHGTQAVRVFVFRGAVDGMSAFFVLYLLGAMICHSARRITALH